MFHTLYRMPEIMYKNRNISYIRALARSRTYTYLYIHMNICVCAYKYVGSNNATTRQECFRLS